jgi:hypothetical protein
MKARKTERVKRRSPGAMSFQTPGCQESFELPRRLREGKIASQYLGEALRVFRWQKKLGEGALAQLDDNELFRILDPESNSIAIIVKHMAGNMRSR